jgi:N-acetylmuramic acid 6-phosphate etherase
LFRPIPHLTLTRLAGPSTILINRQQVTPRYRDVYMDRFGDSSDLTTRMTEARNPRSEYIDRASAGEIAKIINEEDRAVAGAVESALAEIAELMEAAAEAFRTNGRLVYFGAGTSGRLAVLDASECPPTFGVSPEQVAAYIAGGDTALRSAVEAAEDEPDRGAKDVADAGVTERDVVVGVSASGRTPYVTGAIEESKRRGARTGVIVAVEKDRCSIPADVVVSLPVGPEVIAGSTRMKAGTATKMALNMISTGAMILTGRVYRNMMIDLRPGSAKLKVRAAGILREATGIDEERAYELVGQVNGQVKLAVVMAMTGLDAGEAQGLLDKEQGFAYRIIENKGTLDESGERHEVGKGSVDSDRCGDGVSAGELHMEETDD